MTRVLMWCLRRLCILYFWMLGARFTDADIEQIAKEMDP